MASCIMVPDPIFRMALLCKISSWNHISHYQTVLNPCNLKCWTLTSLHYTDVLSWMAISNLYSMKMLFRYHSNVTHYWNLSISYFMRHFAGTINVIVTSWHTWSWWSLEFGTPTQGKKDHFWTKLYRVTSVANNVANPLIFYMSIVHDMLPWYSQAHLKIYGYNLNKKYRNLLP